LIRDGAVLVRDVGRRPGRASGWPPPASWRARRRSRSGDPLEDAVLDALGREPRSLDELLEVFPRDPGVLLAALVRLELAGALERREDLRYARL
jgi:predicted Rossmann fold nucleotide-binding protein DprA/Smf involved in DNA uptake